MCDGWVGMERIPYASKYLNLSVSKLSLIDGRILVDPFNYYDSIMEVSRSRSRPGLPPPHPFYLPKFFTRIFFLIFLFLQFFWLLMLRNRLSLITTIKK